MINFFIRMEIIITGQDSEFADMSNPQGLLYGDGYFIVAEYPDGSRKAHDHIFVNDEEAAEKLLAKIQATKWIAVNKHWRDIDPCYGSAAYVNSGQDEINLQRERLEDDAAPGGW